MKKDERALARILAQIHATWHTTGDSNVSEEQRNAIYVALGPARDVPGDGRRTYLCLLAAQRVAPVLRKAFLVIDPIRMQDPQKETLVERLIITTAGSLQGVLRHEAVCQVAAQAHETDAEAVYALGDSSDEQGLGDEVWTLTQRAGYAWHAGLAALDTALLAYHVEGYRRPLKRLVARANFRDTYTDAAGHAAMAEAWMGEALPPDEIRLHAYWRWWLEEAVPMAARWIPPQVTS